MSGINECPGIERALDSKQHSGLLLMVRHFAEHAVRL